MTKKRLISLIVLITFLVLFLLGTFLDFEISKSLFLVKRAPIWMVFNVILSFFAFGIVSVLGGILIKFGVSFYNKTSHRILVISLGILVSFAGVFSLFFLLLSKEGWFNFLAKPLAIIIILVFAFLFIFYGFRFAYKYIKEEDINRIIFTGLSIVISLIISFLLLYLVSNRVNYLISYTREIEYIPWYKTYENKLELMELKHISDSDFSNFPDFLSIYSPIIIIGSISFIVENEKKIKNIILIVFIGLTVAINILTRLSDGLAYLSDISLSYLIFIIPYFVSLFIKCKL